MLLSGRSRNWSAIPHTGSACVAIASRTKMEINVGILIPSEGAYWLPLQHATRVRAVFRCHEVVTFLVSDGKQVLVPFFVTLANRSVTHKGEKGVMHQNGSPTSWRKKNRTKRRRKLGIGRSGRSVMKRRRSIWKEDLGRKSGRRQGTENDEDT